VSGPAEVRTQDVPVPEPDLAPEAVIGRARALIPAIRAQQDDAERLGHHTPELDRQFAGGSNSVRADAVFVPAHRTAPADWTRHAAPAPGAALHGNPLYCGRIVLRAGEEYMERARRWAQGGAPFSREDDVRLYAMIQQAGQLAGHAVEIIFAAAGSSAAKRGTRLQRYYRDAAMYRGHIAAQYLTTAGELARVHFGLPDSLF